VFAFAIIQPGRPNVRPAFSQAQSHLAVVLECLLIIGVTLEAGAVKTVKMSAKLVSGRNRADYKAPSGDNPHPAEAGLPLLGRRRGELR
jgi:hypothetical protein